MSHKHYYVVPRLRVVEYRAHAGAYLVGVPQPTTVAGLVHRLGLLLAEKYHCAQVALPRMAYGVSNYGGLQGSSLGSRSTSGQYKPDYVKAAPLEDRARASIDLSLLIELSVADGAPLPSVADVTSVLERLGLQGGAFFVEAPVVQSVSLEKAIQRLPGNAFYLTDASETLEALLADQPTLSTADALYALISRPQDPDEYKPRWVPVIAGWRTLPGAVRTTEVSPNAKRHALTEPAIGLARFRSKGSFRAAATQDPESIFWEYAQKNYEGYPYFLLTRGAPANALDFVL